jgi:glycosyltransferase involved in cell wall biosynthesis
MDLSLSLIIPNYNNEEYLEDCIESVVSQTRKPDEVIIVDDASTDNSINIIKKFERKYDFIKLIKNKKNRGVVYSRNKAIKLAKGKYITTLDSDDFYYNKNKLEKEMDIIREHKKMGKDVIAFSNIVLVDKNKNYLKKFKENKIKEGNLLLDILTRNIFIPRDFIFKKNDFISIGGFRDFSLYEDWDLKIRLSKIREFYFSGISGVAYRQHDYGLSSVDFKKHTYFLKRVFRKNVNLLNNKKILAYILFFEFLLKKYIGKSLNKYPYLFKKIKTVYKKIRR